MSDAVQALTPTTIDRHWRGWLQQRDLIGYDELAMADLCAPPSQADGIAAACTLMTRLLADAPALTARADYRWTTDVASFRMAGEAFWQARVLQLLDRVAENREHAPLPHVDLHDVVVRQMFTALIAEGPLPRFVVGGPLHIIVIPGLYNDWSNRLMAVFGDWCARRTQSDRPRDWQALRTFYPAPAATPHRQRELLTLLASVFAATRSSRVMPHHDAGERVVAAVPFLSDWALPGGDPRVSAFDREQTFLRMQFVLAHGAAHRLSMPPTASRGSTPVPTTLQHEAQVDRWSVEVLMAAVLSGVQAIHSWDANVFEEILFPPTLYFCLAQIWADLIGGIVTTTASIEAIPRPAAAQQAVLTARADVERLRRCLGSMHERVRALTPKRSAHEDAIRSMAALIRNAQAFGDSLGATLRAIPASVWIQVDDQANRQIGAARAGSAAPDGGQA